MKGVESAFWEMAYRVNDESGKVLEIPISSNFVLICHIIKMTPRHRNNEDPNNQEPGEPIPESTGNLVSLGGRQISEWRQGTNEMRK